MNQSLTPIIFILAATCMIGCGRRSGDTPAVAPVTQPAKQPATVESKPTMRTLASIEDVPRLTKESLQAIEKKCSCQLPEDYRNFLLSQNGAFPVPDCVKFEEAGHKTASDVFCLFAIGDSRPSLSLEWHRETFSRRLPEGTFPIGRDSSGNLWLMSLRGDNAGAIYFWDHGSYDTFDETDLKNWPKVAANFKEFLDKLSTYDASAEADGAPSRYSLVRQATDGMMKQDSQFSTRGSPGFVWHCDCDNDGNVGMQFVQYEVHAAVTHTCGYSRLRALNGLIKGGQPRLPK